MRVLGLFLLIVAVLAPTTALRTAGAAPAMLLEPLLAWEVAADGAVYVLDAAQRVHELDPQTLAPLRVSARLAEVVSSGEAQLAVTTDKVFVIGLQLDGIQVLDRAALQALEPIALDAAAIAAEPDRAGARLFVIRRAAQPQFEGLLRFDVVTLPLNNLQTEPQPFGPTAAQPFSSLFDLAIAGPQQLLYVGYADTSGSPNRHYRTYHAYDLATGAEIALPIARQAASAAARPQPVQGDLAAISYDWEGFEPSQHRIYLLGREGDTVVVRRTLEGLSGPGAFARQGAWLYLARPRGLWVLQAAEPAYTLRSLVPLVADAPRAVRLSPDGATLYLFGNGWRSALSTSDLKQAEMGAFGPFPSPWLGEGGDRQSARVYFGETGSGIALANLLPSGEWYRTGDHQQTWMPLPQVQYPEDLRLDRLSLSPTLSEDSVVAARGRWNEEQARTAWRSGDAGASWSPWSPPVAYVAGSEGAHTLYVADADGANPRPLPNGGSSENPSWSPGWTHLAFQNNQTGDWEIYRTPAECGELPPGPNAAAAVACQAVRLTDSPGDDILPAWSPDGAQIAFVSRRDGNPEIYVMRTDGSGQTRLTHHAGGDWRPAWLPDSRHLVFTSDRYGSNDIFLLTVPQLLSAGGEPPLTPVAAGPADQRDPAVNGDNEMVFLAGPGAQQPYIVDLTRYLEAARSGRSDGAVDIPPSVGEPVFAENERVFGHPGWLPDGRLLLAADGGIYAVPRAGDEANLIELAPASRSAAHPAGGPPWYEPPLLPYLPAPPSAR